jgi:hypothetical protein
MILAIPYMHRFAKFDPIHAIIVSQLSFFGEYARELRIFVLRR